MRVFGLCLFSGLLILSLEAFSNETRSPRPKPSSPRSSQPPATSNGPLCIDDSTTVVIDGHEVNAHQHILSTMSSNGSNQHKYLGYQQVFNHFGIDPVEIQKRVVYAETLAMTPACSQHYSYGSLLIASVIHNRIRMRNGDVKSVLFQRDQFATSFNQYGKNNSWGGGSSEYEEFLCPRHQDVWKMAHKHVEGLNNESISRPVPDDTTMLYYSRHFADRPKLRPSWESKVRSVKGPVSGGNFDPELVRCVQVWRNKSF